jgi:putative sterol carrier protein
MANELPSAQPSRNFRQTIEGMPLVFQAGAAGDLKADIQFHATGREPGIYHLRIDSGRCVFRKGPSPHPALVIKTPSEVWLRIAAGEISGRDALFQGLYTVEGDIGLLLRFDSLFAQPADFSVVDASGPSGGLFGIFRRKQEELTDTAPAGKRPAGPVPISGMGWMSLLYIPWTLYWVLFDIRGMNPSIGAALPLALMTVIVGYRIVFNRPAWTEIACWLFFLFAYYEVAIARDTGFITWASIFGTLFMAALWLISLTPLAPMPFSAEYSKWGFIRRLWVNSQFLEPNMAISLVWGWTFVIGAGFGIAVRIVPRYALFLTLARYALMIPAFIFTGAYQKKAQLRQFADIDRRMARQRLLAGFGLAAAALMFAAIRLFPPGWL